MGMFSWFTSDTEERIVVDSTKDIFMTGADGRVFHQKEPYDGYGRFGGKDIYEYFAELNGVGSDRIDGINLAYKLDRGRGEFQVAESKGYKAPRLLSIERNVRNWDRFPAPVSDPNQGFGEDYGEWDDEEEDDWRYENVTHKNFIVIREDVQIGDHILEKGDRIKLVLR